LSKRITTRRFGVLTAAAVVSAVAAAAALANAVTGPSSSQSPYVLRSQPGVVTKAILTVGDSVGGYTMVGIPDGLGAFDNGDGTFTLLMNHELRPGTGTARAHGANGALVSKWTIDNDTLQVVKGEDLVKKTMVWTAGAYAETTMQMNRLCSADLSEISAFYNAATGKGFNGRLFLNGEESGIEGRAWAHSLDGTSWDLPALGKYSWENSVAHPGAGDKTVHMGLDDTTPGQVYLYVGDKQTTGNPVEKAGLTNGRLYGIKVTGFPSEPAGSRRELPSRSTTSAAALAQPAPSWRRTATQAASLSSSGRKTAPGIHRTQTTSTSSRRRRSPSRAGCGG